MESVTENEGRNTKKTLIKYVTVIYIGLYKFDLHLFLNPFLKSETKKRLFNIY